MSLGVAYYIRYLIILVVQRKVARTLEQKSTKLSGLCLL